jgi:outer membrane protein TolC
MKLALKYPYYFIIFFIIIGWSNANAQVWTMQQCIDTAQVHNKNLQMSRNNISIGVQKQKEAKANLIPKVTANADYRYFTDLPYQLMPLSVFGGPDGQFKEAQFGVPHNINTNLALAMPLYNPQIYGAIQTTKIASELTTLQYLKTEEQILFEISNLYYNAQILNHQITFIYSNLINAERLLKNIQLLNEQLLARASDVSKVKLQIAQLNTQKESINSRYEQVLNTLKYAMGIPMEQNLQIELSIQFQNINEYTSSSTLDIRISKTQKNLLTSELNTIKNAMFFPNLNLYGTYGTTGFGFDQKPNEFLKFYPIGFAGIQLSYPLFNGTVSKRKINQKTFELKNSDLQIELLTAQNDMLVRNAKMQKIVAVKSVETTTAQVQLAQTIYEQTMLQQKQGTASLTEVLLADNSSREAQQTYLTAIIDYLKADLELKKLTGNISTSKK